MSSKPATAEMTFGFQRFQILTAFVNGFTLLMIVVAIVVLAIMRFFDTQPIMGEEMFYLAIVGLLNNLFVFWILSTNDQSDMNMRGATLHFLGDVLGSIGVIAGAIIIYYTDWFIVDPILSLIIAGIIAVGAWRLTKESAHILLEGAPLNLSQQKITTALEAKFPHITLIHHIHIWSISEDQIMMTLHAKTDLTHINDETLAELKRYLYEEHAIHHVTLQLETQ